jgi:uncharacterized protein
MMGLKELWTQLRGGDHRMLELLHAQLEHALDAVRVVHRVVEGRDDPTTGHRSVVAAERAGDRARGAIVTELSSVLAPPLDREDLFRVSRSIDDVLDNLRDFARELVLFAVDDGAPFVPLVDAIEDSLDALAHAIEELGSGSSAFPRSVLAARKAGNRIRRSYDDALADLLVDPIDAATLKTRELLRRLDVVGLRLGEAADALADGAVKRNH